MRHWHYGLVAAVGLLVGYLGIRATEVVARMLAPVRLEPATLSLGEMVEGLPASFAVHLINRTDQTLRLVRVHYSACGCFFERQKLPETFPPYSRVSLAFGVRTEQLPDRLHAQLTVALATPSGATFTPAMTLMGTVRREIAITPSLLDFGTVLLGGGNSTQGHAAKFDWRDPNS